ncbi:MAG: hypothetical protein HY040_27870 [Planctomycetes bacterium]|nr:hypothetical protein [Planctomycetota bacterium]
MQLITGPNTLYPDSRANPRIPKSFPDGTSNTILIAEAGEPVPWSKPSDLMYNPNGPLPKLGALTPNIFAVALGDASVRTIDHRVTSEKTIRLAINPNDGIPLGSDW